MRAATKTNASETYLMSALPSCWCDISPTDGSIGPPFLNAEPFCAEVQLKLRVNGSPSRAHEGGHPHERRFAARAADDRQATGKLSTVNSDRGHFDKSALRCQHLAPWTPRGHVPMPL